MQAFNPARTFLPINPESDMYIKTYHTVYYNEKLEQFKYQLIWDWLHFVTFIQLIFSVKKMVYIYIIHKESKI